MKNYWLVVLDKKTYLFLVSVPLALGYIIYESIITFSNPNPNVLDFIYKIGFAILLAMICVIFFVKLNSYSHLMNPNHPKHK